MSKRKTKNAAAAKKSVGRPPKSHAKKAEQGVISQRIVDRIAAGESMYKSCVAEGVAHSSFMTWVAADKELADSYARAKNDGIEKMASDLLDICDETPPVNAQGSTDSGYVSAMRLRVDTRKWLLSKMAPKKYGEKLEISGDAENPLLVKSVSEMTEAELDALIAAHTSNSKEDEQL